MKKANVGNPKHENFENLQNNLKRFIAGGISGIIARTCTAPIERSVILTQINKAQYKNLKLKQLITEVLAKEGILSFWKGNGTNCIRIFPYSAVELYCFELYKYMLFKNFQPQDLTNNQVYLISGALSGMTASITTYPLDLVRTIFAFQSKHGGYKKIFRNNGIFGLYRGLGATLIGLMPYSSLKLAIFQTLKNIYYQDSRNKLSDSANFLFGGVAGCVAITLTYPTDLFRKKLQAAFISGEEIKYSSIVKNIYKEAGLLGFYRGLFLAWAKFLPLVSITLTANEKIKKTYSVY